MLKAEIGISTVYYTRGFELISRREGTTASYYVYDGGLSVRALTNETGAVTDTLVFDAFGNETGRTGTTDNPYGFQGEEQDATGLYYLRARYMDPATGTFTTMDTYGGSLSDPMSLHKYLFANSNPVMYSDPSGHSASLIETGAVIGIMSILSGSANAIIAEFIYKNNTDISERSTKDLDKCALTAFLTGFTTCLFSCLATFFVCVFAFTVLECLMAAAICSLIAWMLGDIADYNYRNGNEVVGIGLEITQQAFISAEIGFVICGLNGGGIESARIADDYSADSNTSGNGTWKDINEEIDDWYQEQYNILDKNQTTGRPVNRKGVEYPRVIVKDYGEVPFPEGPYTPNNSQTLRKAFTESYKKSFKEWWIGQGRAWPEGKVNIHHIKPLSRGGTNDFNNLVPLVQPEEHQPFTNWWMSYP